MSASTDYIPGTEAALVDYCQVFAAGITATPVPLGLTAAQATAFQALLTAFIAARETTKNRSTRSTAAVIVKNEKKTFLIKNLRLLAGIIQKKSWDHE